MPAVNLPAGFSARPVVLKVEQRFGMAGFARLVKLLELFAASPLRDKGVIELPVSEWADALQAGPLNVSVLLDYLSSDGWLSQARGEEPGAPLRVTLTDFADFLPALDMPTTAEQWCAWFTSELSMPDQHGTDPDNQALFRRWCATNVTIEEMNAAIELAVKAGRGFAPACLHSLLMTVRKEKLELARR